MLIFAPFVRCGIDKPAAVIAVYAGKGEREGGCNAQQGLKNPFMGLVKGRAEFDPAGIDIRGGKGEASALSKASKCACNSPFPMLYYRE
ncbi:MAG: hypothetical protein LBH43_09405 [Treponema sp.]|jgi:hypothetical protein|nr:hypothetical protein [Treponema sp.]